MRANEQLLESLSRDELKIIAEALGVHVTDKRMRDQFLGALKSIGDERFRAYLNTCSRDWLKDVCRRLQFDDSGRAKSEIVDRLIPPKDAIVDPPHGPGHQEGRGVGGPPPKGPRPQQPPEPASDDLRAMEAALWEAADQLRANSKLNATEYFMPVLGLIFLRHASTRFEEVKAEIEKSLPSRGGKTRPITADDFKGRSAIFIPESARFDHLAALPDDQDLGGALNDAMRAIEHEDPEQLEDVLPKEYHRFDKKLLGDLVRIFNRDALRTAQGDVFGRIYEYFLNSFASSMAQEEGQFFTPPSLVRLIVNVIEPDHGTVFDPAVGSAGMLVQSRHFTELANAAKAQGMKFVGREKSESTVRLAKMNVAVHGFNAHIMQGNSFYDRDQDDGLLGACDFVMANPPFNVDGVDPTRVKGDPRLFTQKKIPGVTKGSEDKKGQKPPGVSNANYLWIQYFYAYLNSQGRAGFVMAASATDAGHGEQEIRSEIIDTGDVDAIIRIGEKFFYTRTLPCTLWFFDRGRPKARKGKTLMLDARNIHRVVSRRVHDFSEEQLANLTAIVWLYRGQPERYLDLVARYLGETNAAALRLPSALEALAPPLAETTRLLSAWRSVVAAQKGVDRGAVAELTEVLEARAAALLVLETDRTADLTALQAWASRRGRPERENAAQKAAYARLEPTLHRLRVLQKHVNEVHRLTVRALDLAEKTLGGRSDDRWDNKRARVERQTLDDARQNGIDALKRVGYFVSQVHWLQSRFPDAVFAPVPGLCRVVNRAEITKQDDSLTPGRYVGVAPASSDDDEDFEERLRAIHEELESLNAEAADLATRIAANFEELLG
jgi:type I restriction enzyme M protein